MCLPLEPLATIQSTQPPASPTPQKLLHSLKCRYCSFKETCEWAVWEPCDSVSEMHESGGEGVNEWGSEPGRCGDLPLGVHTLLVCHKAGGFTAGSLGSLPSSTAVKVGLSFTSWPFASAWVWPLKHTLRLQGCGRIYFSFCNPEGNQYTSLTVTKETDSQRHLNSSGMSAWHSG